MVQSAFIYESGHQIGPMITSNLFASGYVFRTDSVEEGSSFSKIYDVFDFKILRYPGGTPTESLFDLENPDSKFQTSIFTGKNKEVTPISDFFEFCIKNGVSPQIVVPTYRFFNLDSRSITPNAETVIQKFVRDVVNGIYGNINVFAFEIGNEWFNDELFDWSVEEFAELQKEIASFISEALTELGVRSQIKIYVQAGHGEQDLDGNGLSDNSELAEVFNKDNLQTIDGVINHLYAAPRYEHPLDLDPIAEGRINAIADYWNVNGENSLDIVISEWNVGGDGPNTKISGLERSSALIKLWVDMIKLGVDVANIWTTQAPGDGPAALSYRESKGGELTPTGLLFKMLQESLIGTTLVNPENDYTYVDNTNKDAGFTFTFEGKNKVIVLFVSGINENVTIEGNFQVLLDQGYSVHGSILSALPESNASDWYAQATISSIKYKKLDGNIANDGILTIDLSPYSFMKLEFNLNDHIYGDKNTDKADLIRGSEFSDQIYGLSGDDTLMGKSGSDMLVGGTGNDTVFGNIGRDTISGNRGDDFLTGGKGADNISGGLGHDKIRGGTGGDKIFGNSGNDTLSGGRGSDTLFGGKDSDQLYGGYGNDILRGGHNNDTLEGGPGNDIVVGGNGSDILTGGNGNDVFVFRNVDGRDKITDYSVGEDILKFVGWKYADLTFSENGGDLEIQYGNNYRVLLEGLDFSDLNIDDFAFI